MAAPAGLRQESAGHPVDGAGRTFVSDRRSTGDHRNLRYGDLGPSAALLPGGARRHGRRKAQALVDTTTTLVWDGKDSEVALKRLVPGDIVRLAAGDMVPADVRVFSAMDLFLNQATLTGESLLVEKKAAPASGEIRNPFDLRLRHLLHHDLCVQRRE